MSKLQSIVNLYSDGQGRSDARSYLSSVNLLEFIDKIAEKSVGRIEPNYQDLARLHKTIIDRKVFTILEFGCGYSSIIMADALRVNEENWSQLSERPNIRNSNQFQLHTVDTEEKWIEQLKQDLTPNLATYVYISQSNVLSTTFQGRDCHVYEILPDVVPDFIYLDGPDPSAVCLPSSNVENITPLSSWNNQDRVVMAADLLHIEPWLLPGTLVVVDGRKSNVRFLVSHFYRSWVIDSNNEADISAFELQEAPLGKINEGTLLYCLGSRIKEW